MRGFLGRMYLIYTMKMMNSILIQKLCQYTFVYFNNKLLPIIRS